MKADAMSFLRDFIENARFMKSQNSTFIVMVPKKGGPNDLKDYIPINLIESLIN